VCREAVDVGKSSFLWWVLLGCATAMNVAVATVGAIAWASGGIDPSRLDASRIVFSFYILLGLVSVLAIFMRWRFPSGVGEALLRYLAVGWAGLMCTFLVLAFIFKWAV
jgi:hypothetical protein